MKRREFLKSSSAFALYLSSQNLIASEGNDTNAFSKFFRDIFSIEEERIIYSDKKTKIEVSDKLNKEPIDNIQNKLEPIDNIVREEKTYIQKDKDIFVEDNLKNQFLSVRNKLNLIQNHVGYGNFNVISFDEMLMTAKYSNKIESFTKEELEFLEFIFYYDPKYHGFYGDRVSSKITQEINKKEIVKIPYTGHYLFKGEPEKVYNQMVADIGDSLILTSGVRSIVKQTKLFMDKIESVDGNLSVASKSLAPPAFTYHSISDFDVGKKGFGYDNFTPRFALTEEFFKMRKLKYIDMRYTINNKDGVRYEPWHVKIV